MHQHLLVATSQVTPGGRVALILIGICVLGLGVFMVVKPRVVARPPKWQFRERAEPSLFSLDLTRIGGVIWTVVAIALIVVASVA